MPTKTIHKRNLGVEFYDTKLTNIQSYRGTKYIREAVKSVVVEPQTKLGFIALDNGTKSLPWTFTRNSIAYTEDGVQVSTNQPRTKNGAILIEEGTTNLVAPYSTQFDNMQVMFYPSGLASGKTWTDCWSESEKAYVLGSDMTTYKIQTKDINLGQTYPAGTKITISWKHKGYLWSFYLCYFDTTTSTWKDWNPTTDQWSVGGEITHTGIEGTYGLHIAVDGIKTKHCSFPTAAPVDLVKLQSRYFNVSITYTLPAPSDKIRFIFNGYFSNQVNMVGYLKEIQVEVKPYATSFVNGTRSYEKLALPLSSSMCTPRVGTASIRFYYPNGGITGTHATRMLLNIGKADTGTDRISLAWDGTSKYFSLYIAYAGNDGMVGSGTLNPSVGWHTLTGVWKYVGNNQNILKLYLDGTLIASSSSMSDILFFDNWVHNYAYVGNSGTEWATANTYFDFVAFWNRALSDTEVKQILTKYDVINYTTPTSLHTFTNKSYTKNISESTSNFTVDGVSLTPSEVLNEVYDTNGNFELLGMVVDNTGNLQKDLYVDLRVTKNLVDLYSGDNFSYYENTAKNKRLLPTGVSNFNTIKLFKGKKYRYELLTDNTDNTKLTVLPTINGSEVTSTIKQLLSVNNKTNNNLIINKFVVTETNNKEVDERNGVRIIFKPPTNGGYSFLMGVGSVSDKIVLQNDELIIHKIWKAIDTTTDGSGVISTPSDYVNTGVPSFVIDKSDNRVYTLPSGSFTNSNLANKSVILFYTTSIKMMKPQIVYQTNRKFDLNGSVYVLTSNLVYSDVTSEEYSTGTLKRPIDEQLYINGVLQVPYDKVYENNVWKYVWTVPTMYNIGSIFTLKPVYSKLFSYSTQPSHMVVYGDDTTYEIVGYVESLSVTEQDFSKEIKQRYQQFGILEEPEKVYKVSMSLGLLEGQNSAKTVDLKGKMINVKLTDGAGKSYYLGGCIPENGVDFDLMSGIENLSLICLKFYEEF